MSAERESLYAGRVETGVPVTQEGGEIIFTVGRLMCPLCRGAGRLGYDSNSVCPWCDGAGTRDAALAGAWGILSGFCA